MEGEAFPRGKIAGAVSAPTNGTTARKEKSRLFGGENSKPSDSEELSSKQKRRAKSSDRHEDIKNRKRSKSAADAAPGTSTSGGQGRAEELSAKRLRAGISVLARVRRVGSKQVVLSLPSGLTGYCKLNDVNHTVAAALAKVQSGDDEGDAVAEPARGDSAGLAAFLRPGQYVPATVLRLEGDMSSTVGPAAALAASLMGPSGDKHRRIFVSLRPEVLHAGSSMSLSHMKVGSLVSGYIASVEDHGYAVRLGIDGVTAFLPFSACDGSAGQDGSVLNAESAGCPLYCTVSSINKAARSVTLACKAEWVSVAVAKEATHTIHTIKPGALVEATVDKVLSSGLSVTFLGFFKATISLAHLPSPAHAMWQASYTPGTVLTARILFIDTLEKVIALSAAPHVVDLGRAVPSPISGLGVGGPAFDIADGAVIENGVVLRVDPKLGMLVGWAAGAKVAASGVEVRILASAAWGRTGYVHISRAADGGARVDSMEKLFKLGATVRVRALGFAGLEGSATLSSRPSVVDAAVLRASDVHPGALVEGTVHDVMLDRAGDSKAGERAAAAAEGKGLVARISLGEGVLGDLAAMHLADVLPTRAMGSAKARRKLLDSVGLVEGGKVKARVLTVDAVSGRIQVTLKRTLVASQGPPLTSFVVAAELLRACGSAAFTAHGFVTAVKESGLIVTFFGNAHGLVPTSDLVAAGLIPAEKATVVPSPAPPVGSAPSHTLRMTAPVELLQATYSMGQVIKVRVVRVQAEKGRMLLSVVMQAAKPALSFAGDVDMKGETAGVSPQADRLPPPGTVVSGTILRNDIGEGAGAGGGVCVRVTGVYGPDGAHSSGGLADEGVVLYGSLAPAQLSDHAGHTEAVASVLQPGQLVHRMLVLAHTPGVAGGPADSRRPLLSLSLKPLLLTASKHGKSLDMLPRSIEGLRSGMLVAGYVASVTVNGAFVRFLGSCTGLAPRNKWPAPPDADVSAEVSYEVGQSVLAIVDKVTAASSGSEAKPGRFSLTLSPASIAHALPSTYFTPTSHTVTCWDAESAAHPAATAAAVFLRGCLLEQEALFAAEPLKHESDDGDDEDNEREGDAGEGGPGPIVLVPSRYTYRPGARLVAVVQACNSKAAVVGLPPPALSALPSAAGSAVGARGLDLPSTVAYAVHSAGSAACLDSYTPGSHAHVLVLDVDAEQGMVQVLLEESLSSPPPTCGKDEEGKKRKRKDKEQAVSTTATLSEGLLKSLDAPLRAEGASESCTDAGISLGSVVTAKVVLVKGQRGAGVDRAPYAVVLVHPAPRPGQSLAPIVGYVALSDFVGSSHTAVKPGMTLQAVVTQLPTETVEKMKKGKEAKIVPACLGMAAASCAAVNSLLLLTACPALVLAQAQVGAQAGVGGGAMDHKPKSRGSQAADIAAGLLKAVSDLLPGNVVTAVLRNGEDKDREVKGGGARARAHSTASGADEEEEEEGADRSKASRVSRACPPVRAVLYGVRGMHSARISLVECADVNPYSGTWAEGEGVEEGLRRYKELLALPDGTRVKAKIVAVAVRRIVTAKSSPATKRARSASESNGGNADGEAVYEIELTVRPADLSLPDLHLACARPSWSADARLVARSTIIHATAQGEAEGGPACLLGAVRVADSAALDSEGKGAPASVDALSRGTTGWAIVEGLASDGAHLLLGLGGGVKARCYLLEAGDGEEVREESTGMLHATPAAARALTARQILRTHPLGSCVPFVVLQADPGKRQAEVSVRRARAAMVVAGASAAAQTGVAKKKAKVAVSSAPALEAPGYSPLSVRDVAQWLPSADIPPPIPGRVCLAVVQAQPGHGPGPASASPPSTDVTFSSFSVMPSLPVTSTQVYVRVGEAGSIRGCVDCTSLGDRETWGGSPAARYRQADVVCGVVLLDGGGSASVGTGISRQVDFSCRPSIINAAQAALAVVADAVAVPSSKGKRKAADASAPSVPLPNTPATASAVIQALETVERATVLATGAKVTGFVVSAGERGVFVRLCRDVTARVPLSRLADHFIKDAAAAFPLGKLVSGLVISADVNTRRAELSLRRTEVDPRPDAAKSKTAQAELALGYFDLRVGSLFSGRVTTVAQFGVFVALDGTDKNKVATEEDESMSGQDDGLSKKSKAFKGRVQPISGLVHASEVEDPVQGAQAAGMKGGKKGKGGVSKDSLASRFSSGDRVQVVVVTVDGPAKRLSLSMKPSRVRAALEAQEEEEEDADDEEAEAAMVEENDEESNKVENDEVENDDDEDDEDENDDDEDDEDENDDDEEVDKDEDAPRDRRASTSGRNATGILSFLTAGLKPDEDSEDEKSVPKEGAKKLGAKKLSGPSSAPAAASSGFGWDSSLLRRGGQFEAHSAHPEDEDEEQDEDMGAKGKVLPVSAGGARKAKKRAAADEEAETRRLEARLASGDAERNPETVEDFERLSTARPTDAETWIRYMAWQLSVTEVDGARRVVERAFVSVPSSDEDARKALWTAYMNLEAQHGDDASLGRVFARAQSSVDPVSMHFALLGVYQRAGDSRLVQVEALFGIATKKFGKEHPELWSQWAAFRMRRGDAAGSRTLLDQARRLLPASSHGALALKFALLEYRHAVAAAGTDQTAVGSQERGRTLFESLLAAAPRRLDLWSVYLDQETSIYVQRHGARAGAGASGKGKAGAAPAADDLRFIRNLFERLVSGKHSSKKMKFTLKKYANFEKAHGDAAGLKRVQQVAESYVAQQVGSAAEEDDSEDLE